VIDFHKGQIVEVDSREQEVPICHICQKHLACYALWEYTPIRATILGRDRRGCSCPACGAELHPDNAWLVRLANGVVRVFLWNEIVPISNNKGGGNWTKN